MNLTKETVNRTFLQALIAGILLTPVSFILDVTGRSDFLRLLRLTLRDPITGLGFVLVIWLLASGLNWGVDVVAVRLLPAKPSWTKWQKDGLIIGLLLPLMLVVLMIN